MPTADKNCWEAELIQFLPLRPDTRTPERAYLTFLYRMCVSYLVLGFSKKEMGRRKWEKWGENCPQLDVFYRIRNSH